MRISDWSSDVCSADLQARGDRRALRDEATEIEHALVLHIGRIFARVGGVVARMAARGVRTGDDPRTRHKSGDVGLGLVERGDPGLALAEYRDRGVEDRKSTRLNSRH